MGVSDILNKITDHISGTIRKFGSAIIVAAGSGTRAATGDTTKQFVELCGMPVIAHTVDTFEKCKAINEIIIVAKSDEVPLYDGMINRYGWKKISCVVAGGNTRQESVLCGFKKISDKSELVYIHDGARCLVTEDMIEKTGHAAALHGAAFAAHKATDTVKVESGENKLETIDRNMVWLAQTPQVFLTELYRASTYIASQNGFTATDDCMLAENAGFKVIPVDCGSENMKITLPCDFALAEAIISYREKYGDEEKKK